MAHLRPLHQSLLAAAALAAWHAPAPAQTEVPVLPIRGHITVGPAYSGRTVANVYDAPATEPFAIGHGCSYVMEDIDFDPGPWGAQFEGPRIVREFSFMFQTTGWMGNPSNPSPWPVPMRFILEFYALGPHADAAAAYADGLGIVGSPIATQTIDIDLDNESGYRVTARGLAINLGNNSRVLAALRCVDRVTGVRFADGTPGSAQPTGQTAAVYNIRLDATSTAVGATLPDYARDQGSLNLWQGGPLLIGSQVGSTNDHRATAATPPFHLFPWTIRAEAFDPCDFDADRNGVTDMDDVSYAINAIAGGDNPTDYNPDRNNDGNTDYTDIEILIIGVIGGPCP